jgi:hypothetical protein
MWTRGIASFAEGVARALWSSSAKLVRKPAPSTRLTQRIKREVKGAPPLPTSIKAPRRENLCKDCGRRIKPESTKCARCATTDTRKNILEVALIGRQTANSPKARLKHAETQRRIALAQRAWKPSDQPVWLTEKFFGEKVQPRLASMPASAIARKISVSIWYAGRIREGYRPHERHWTPLANLVGIFN